MYKITPTKTITPDFVQEAKELARKSGGFDEQIVKRIHYIMLSIFNAFGKRNAYWYFYGAPEGEQGNLWRYFDEETIGVIVDDCPGDSMVIILNDGSEWGLEDSIPTRWLYEDFEAELHDGKRKYKELEVARKKAEKTKEANGKKNDAALAKAAKSKLSKAELLALKRTL